MKKAIIISSILIILVSLSLVLVNVVFCVKNITCSFISDDINYEKVDIISSSEIKNTDSTLLLDKDLAIHNIESKYPNIKVVGIRTTSLMSVDIRVRSRYPLYFVEKTVEDSTSYYVLDEELKVLDAVDTEPNLVKIDLEFTDSPRVGEFILLDRSVVLDKLYEAVYTTAITSEGEQSRHDMCELFKTVKFDKAYTLNGSYDRLIIKLKSGLTFDIAKPEIDLENKINICFTKASEIEGSSGEIRIYFDKNDNIHYEYFNN